MGNEAMGSNGKQWEARSNGDKQCKQQAMGTVLFAEENHYKNHELGV